MRKGEREGGKTPPLIISKRNICLTISNNFLGIFVSPLELECESDDDDDFRLKLLYFFMAPFIAPTRFDEWE